MISRRYCGIGGDHGFLSQKCTRICHGITTCLDMVSEDGPQLSQTGFDHGTGNGDWDVAFDKAQVCQLGACSQVDMVA